MSEHQPCVACARRSKVAHFERLVVDFARGSRVRDDEGYVFFVCRDCGAAWTCISGLHTDKHCRLVEGVALGLAS